MEIALQIEGLRFYMDAVSTNHPVFHFVEQADDQIVVFIEPPGLLPQGLACSKHRGVR